MNWLVAGPVADYLETIVEHLTWQTLFGLTIYLSSRTANNIGLAQ